ncbi:MAG: hypothetical protein MR598_03490 [Erysipelotrichaceae bacterium]|nr:hypothetical protein [Erysipelotrichaceae bacterium]
MKKKYGLFKVLTVLLLLVVIATYLFEGRQGTISYLALGDVFLNYMQSFYYFFDTAIFSLVVGGFYGLLNRIPAYKKLVKNIADKVSVNRKVFVIIMTIVFALVSSLTGLNLILFLFVPFVVSIILLLGYDKLVALSATVGGIIVGFIGGIFLTFKDASSQYAVSYTTFDKLVGLDGNWSNIFPKILLLVVALGLLIFYIVSYMKKLENDELSYELTKGDNLFVEVKDRTGKKIVVDDNNIRVWPFIVVISLLFILLVLGYLPWSDLFGINCFDKFHTWLTGLKIGDYVVFTNLISSSFSAFGTWGNLGNFMMSIVLIILFGFILQLIYRVKFEDAMDGFIYGVKKLIPATMIAIFAYCVLVCSYNNGFVETIITKASESFGDNVVINSLVTILGSILNVDLYYTSAGVFTSLVSTLPEKANLSVYAIMFQSLYGLVQIIGPTSLLLIVGLSYLDVPYKTWFKYIWRFVVELLIVILIILMIVSLL